PVMAKCRIGHFVEAQILESLGVDYIDESEVLTPADEEHHINKHGFKVPFVCGCRDLGEALRRIAEGAAMIRTKGEAGTGNVVEAVRHARAVNAGIRKLQGMNHAELVHEAKQIGAPVDLLAECQRLSRLPVVNKQVRNDAPLVGVLAMQGAFAEHQRALEASGARTRLVKDREDLEGLDALVLPGGESTTMTMLMERVGLLEPLRDAISRGLP